MLKRLILIVWARWRNKQSRISFSSSVSRCSILGRLSKIEKDVTLFNTKLGTKINIERGATLANVCGDDNIHFYHHSTIVNCVFGSNVAIFENSKIYNSSVGSYSYVAADCKIFNTSIGKFCSIGPNVIFGNGDHPTDRMSTSPSFYSKSSSNGKSFLEDNTFVELPPIKIGNDVWIGANSYLKHGVTIGDGAIIAAGAVVTRNVHPYSIVGGVPGKLLRMRFDQGTIEEILALKWWDWNEGEIAKHIHLFAKDYLHEPKN